MTTKAKAQKPEGKAKHVISCNFRSAGRISNEHARALSSIHESLARNLSIGLEGFLGTEVSVQIGALDQLPSEEYIAGVPPLSCIVPFSMSAVPGNIIVQCDINLVFPMIDLLLGGAGGPAGASREMSEIEEEIMVDVFSLIMRQAESAWRMPGGSLSAGKRIKPSMLDQVCSYGDRVTCLKFELEIGQVAGSFQLVVPSTFINFLLQQVKLEQPQKRATLRYFPKHGIRDRILDSDVVVAVELPSLKLAVKDLLGLLPGSVVKFRAPVRTPGMLMAGGHGIFEATPVRNGSRKAAQLGRRVASTNLGEV